MAKRLTDTEIWDKDWFMALPPRLKCLVRFVFDKCDLAGVWSPNWTLAKIYIGEDVNETELLNIDSGNQFKKLTSGKIFCLDFISFQNGNLETKSPIHKKILQLLDTHNIPYPYPKNSVIVEVIVKEEVEVDVIVDAKIGEILNSETWLNEVCINNRIEFNYGKEFLIEFLKDQKTKDEIQHRSEKEIKKHFINWLRTQLLKKKTQDGKQTNFEHLTTAYNGIQD